MADKKPKLVDDIDMSFEDNKPKEAATTAEESAKVADQILEYEGKKVAVRKPNGDIEVFDKEGQQIPSDVLQTLYEKYKKEPDYDQLDTAKKGPLTIRHTREIVDPESVQRRLKTVECQPHEAEMVSETQWYESGQMLSRTIEAKKYPAIKFLRGEIDFPEKKEG